MSRHLSESEKWLVQAMLLDVHSLKITPGALSVVEVDEMDDGGMGGYYLSQGSPIAVLEKILPEKSSWTRMELM